MGQRKDGQKTRLQLLETACDVFGEKGFRDAKVADICRRAGANVAAVNYYFGSKDEIYKAAWRLAFERDVPQDPPPPADIPPEERLRMKIHTLIQKFCQPGAGRCFTRMYLMELANPTGLIDESWRELIEPRRRNLLEVIRDLIGPDAPEEAVLFCELSVINQCRAFLMLGVNDLTHLVRQQATPELVLKLADHITRFSLAGIRETGRPPSALK